MSPRINSSRAKALFLFILLLMSMHTFAAPADNYQRVGGIDIYIGVIPADIIRRHTSPAAAQMHGGVPKGKNQYHLVVALYDQTTRMRIADAEVTATVAEITLAGNTKKLEAMKEADSVTYGNYFAMSDRNKNQIDLRIVSPGKGLVTARFYYAVGDD